MLPKMHFTFCARLLSMGGFPCPGKTVFPQLAFPHRVSFYSLLGIDIFQLQDRNTFHFFYPLVCVWFFSQNNQKWLGTDGERKKIPIRCSVTSVLFVLGRRKKGQGRRKGLKGAERSGDMATKNCMSSEITCLPKRNGLGIGNGCEGYGLV